MSSKLIENVSDNEHTESSSEEQYYEEAMPLPQEIIYPGLILKREYILLQKIGHGNNATVWICYHIPKKSFFAMKIQDNQCYHDGCREVVIIKKINQYCKEHENKNIYCVNMLDYFIFEEDEETKFVCSVYELYAGNIHMVINAGKHKYGLPIPSVKQIIRQLLTALSTLHQELDIIHTDIKPENILFKGMPENHVTVFATFTQSGFQEKYQKLCELYENDEARFMEELEVLAFDSVKDICEIFTDDNEEELMPDEDDYIEGEMDSSEESEDEENNGVFNERKQSVDDVIEYLDYKVIHDLDEDYDFENILNNRPYTTDVDEVIDDKYVINCETALTDFGNSYFRKKRTKNEIQDRRYRAPEVILDIDYGFACDIWSVMCVAYELLTGFILFEPVDLPLNQDLHHLYLIEKLIDTIPIEMKKASNRTKFLFDKSRKYHIKNVKEFTRFPMKDRLIKQFTFSEGEAQEISDFLLSGLKINPLERSSATDLLNHPWLNN